MKKEMDSFYLGPKEWQSKYGDKEIIFDKMPTEEWQYMATATGRIGVAVTAKEPLILQINHEGSLDERGYWHPIARIIFDFQGCPLSRANFEGCFSMIHDLKHSEIRIFGKNFVVSVCAYINRELIGVEIIDSRTNPLPIGVSMQVPYHAKNASDGSSIAFWHENGEKTCWHEINVASGMENDENFEDVLKGRCFGLGVKAEGVQPEGNGWFLAPKNRHMLWITAESGKQKFPDILFRKLQGEFNKKALDSAQNKWFEEYWKKVWFECESKEERAFVIGYELYRYFSAVSSGKNREFPVRFQILLLCNVMEKCHWATMQIHSVQTLQAYFGMLRCGNWEGLQPFEKDYRNKIDFYRAYTSNWGAKNGLFIPYETNMWGTAHYHTLGGNETIFEEYNLYTLSKHKWSMYSYEHGLVILMFLWDVAKAKDEENSFFEWGIDAINRYLLFFLERYAIENGKLVFEPATSGETWFNCRNPASWIAMFQAFLPKIIAEAKVREDSSESFFHLRETAEKLSQLIPALPVGKWRWTEKGLDIILGKDEESVLLPAETFSRHPPINAENPELYCLWPYGLFGSEEDNYELALRTYKNRFWKNLDTGWALDCIWAARLGLTEEAKEFSKWQFPTIVRFPGGLCFEDSPARKDMPELSVLPSMQGMGNLVCPLFEMICQERNGYLLLLPAWDEAIPFKAAFYTALAGRVELVYDGKGNLKCALERSATVKTNVKYKINLKMIRLTIE